MIHALKILPEFFKAMAAGTKSFEVRKNDRPYHTGDYVALNEWKQRTIHRKMHIAKDCLYIKRSGILQGRLCDFGFRALRNRRNKRKPPYVARQIGGGSGI